MKTIMTLFLVLTSVVSYRVYDRQNRLIEVWQDRGDTIDIFDHQMSRKGYIRKEVSRWSRFDKESNRVATIERDNKGVILLDKVER